MGLYERYVLPHMINVACGAPPVLKQREKVVPLAEGRVLEIGMGSGINLSFYDPQNVEWLDLPGEEVPLDDASVDTVVLTYTLCTIPDFRAALAQMRRVLKPGGTLLFCEHGEAPDPDIRKWQGRINPLWKKVAGGCNLNRPIPGCLEEAGFSIGSLETMYVPNTPKIAAFNYWGRASVA